MNVPSMQHCLQSPECVSTSSFFRFVSLSLTLLVLQTPREYSQQSVPTAMVIRLKAAKAPAVVRSICTPRLHTFILQVFLWHQCTLVRATTGLSTRKFIGVNELSHVSEHVSEVQARVPHAVRFYALSERDNSGLSPSSR